MPHFADYNYNTLSPPFFQYYTDIEKSDDKADKFVFDITLKGVTSAQIRSLFLTLKFTYKLSSMIDMKMQTLAVIQVSAPNGLGSAKAYGELKLKQNQQLREKYGDNKRKYNESPLDLVLNDSLTKMYEEYVAREEYTIFDSDVVVMPYGDPNQATVHVEMMVPFNQEVLYNPAFFGSVKPAWIQYIYLFVLLYYIIVRFVLRYIYSNQIMQTNVSDNLPKANDKMWYKKNIVTDSFD